MNYEYQCLECKKITNGSSSAEYYYGEEIECPWCGRVSVIINMITNFELKPTDKKVSPTELEKLEKLKIKVVE